MVFTLYKYTVKQYINSFQEHQITNKEQTEMSHFDLDLSNIMYSFYWFLYTYIHLFIDFLPFLKTEIVVTGNN